MAADAGTTLPPYSKFFAVFLDTAASGRHTRAVPVVYRKPSDIGKRFAKQDNTDQ
jgi:hypothetical protein